MSRSLNKVILIGNLGADPEVRSMPSGGHVATLSIATSESRRDRTTGETQERTEWHRVVLFNRLAEVARDYLSKGSKVYAEGTLRTRKWQDNQGQDRYTTEIICNQLIMLDRRGGEGDADMGGYNQYPEAQSAPAAPAGGRQEVTREPVAAATPAQPAGGASFEDDDIPF